MGESIYDFEVETLTGEQRTLREHEGKVMLIVNTASRCGFTPQYAGLEKLHETYAERGLAVLGFPCNQFGKQEPGSADEIGSFCERNYGVRFPMYAKIDVNGDEAHPLYRHLKKAQTGILGTEAIKWNFTKFLVDRDGRVVARFAPKITPDGLTAEIEKLL
jgi:glutathione peroxidase